MYDEFYDAGFYWGADFNNFEDPPHFEASEELLTQWKNEGFLNADADFSDLPQFKSPYPGDEGEPYKNDGTSNYNENVDMWQRRMEELGWNLTVDGYYGPESASIARQFQREAELDDNGIVGSETWKASFASDAPQAPPVHLQES